eukprot:2806602-Ditylum_brightwellii.AAC.1
MATLPRHTKAIQHQVETGKVQQSKLCQQAPPPTVHQQRHSQFVVNSTECTANPNSVQAQIRHVVTCLRHGMQQAHTQGCAKDNLG